MSLIVHEMIPIKFSTREPDRITTALLKQTRDGFISILNDKKVAKMFLEIFALNLNAKLNLMLCIIDSRKEINFLQNLDDVRIFLMKSTKFSFYKLHFDCFTKNVASLVPLNTEQMDIL